MTVQTPAAPAPSGLYRGWSVAIGGLVIAILAIGITTYTFGLFVVPATRDLGVTRADANIVLIMIAIGSSGMAPLVGWLVDRVPAPLIISGGASVLTAGLLIIAASSAPWLIALVALVMIPAGILSCSSIVVSTLATRWFRRRLGRVLGIVATSGTAGGIFVPPVAGLLLEQTDWRSALTILALGFGAIALLICRFVIVSRPEPGELERWNEAEIDDGIAATDAAADAEGGRRWRYGEVLRNPTFWLVATGCGLLLANLYAIVISLASAMIEEGNSVQASALTVSVLTTSAVAGKLIMGFLSERVDSRILMGGCAIAHFLMLLALNLQPGYGVMIAASALTGMGLGGILPLQGKLIEAYFGRLSYGTVLGLMGLTYQPFAILSTRIVALVRDASGSYSQAFASLMPAVAIAFVVVLFLPAVKRPARGRKDG